MVIIIDTNIWIEFFKGNKQYTEQVGLLIKNSLAVTIEPIFAELLYGVRSSKDRTTILNYWNVLRKLELPNNYLIDAAQYSNDNKFYGSGIGLIDAIIIKAAKDNNCLICTLDKKMLKYLDGKSVYNITEE